MLNWIEHRTVTNSVSNQHSSMEDVETFVEFGFKVRHIRFAVRFPCRRGAAKKKGFEPSNEAINENSNEEINSDGGNSKNSAGSNNKNLVTKFSTLLQLRKMRREKSAKSVVAKSANGSESGVSAASSGSSGEANSQRSRRDSAYSSESSKSGGNDPQWIHDFHYR